MSEQDCAKLRQRVRERVKRLHLHLQVVYAGVVVAAAALHHQDAEQDREIACVLKYLVADRLSAQIDRAAELVADLQPLPGDPDEIDL